MEKSSTTDSSLSEIDSFRSPSKPQGKDIFRLSNGGEEEGKYDDIEQVYPEQYVPKHSREELRRISHQYVERPGKPATHEVRGRNPLTERQKKHSGQGPDFPSEQALAAGFGSEKGYNSWKTSPKEYKRERAYWRQGETFRQKQEKEAALKEIEAAWVPDVTAKPDPWDEGDEEYDELEAVEPFWRDEEIAGRLSQEEQTAWAWYRIWRGQQQASEEEALWQNHEEAEAKSENVVVAGFDEGNEWPSKSEDEDRMVAGRKRAAALVKMGLSKYSLEEWRNITSQYERRKGPEATHIEKGRQLFTRREDQHQGRMHASGMHRSHTEDGRGGYFGETVNRWRNRKALTEAEAARELEDDTTVKPEVSRHDPQEGYGSLVAAARSFSSQQQLSEAEPVYDSALEPDDGASEEDIEQYRGHIFLPEERLLPAMNLKHNNRSKETLWTRAQRYFGKGRR